MKSRKHKSIVAGSTSASIVFNYFKDCVHCWWFNTWSCKWCIGIFWRVTFHLDQMMILLYYFHLFLKEGTFYKLQNLPRGWTKTSLIFFNPKFSSVHRKSKVSDGCLCVRYISTWKPSGTTRWWTVLYVSSEASKSKLN